MKIGLLVLFILGGYSFHMKDEHPLKLSTCIITCSPENNTLALTFHFFEDDFGDHLSNLSKREITFEEHSSEVNKIIKDYVISQFDFFIGDERQELEWKNAYKKDLVEYVEFTIFNNDCSLLKNIKIKNTLMLDAFEKQSNLVRIDLKGDKNFKTLRFNQSNTLIKTVLD